MPEKRYQLTVRSGPKQGEVYYLLANTITIGRDPMADMVIKDPEVSRQHARLTRVEDDYRLQDLGSTNGTTVDGERVGDEPQPLQPGQAINIGSGVTLLFDEVPDTETAELQGDPSATMPEASAPPLPTNVLPPLPEMSDEPAAVLPPPAMMESPAPAMTEPPAPKSPPIVSTSADSDNDDSRRKILISVGIGLLALCLCCAFLAFMWFVGGDWLFQQLN